MNNYKDKWSRFHDKPVPVSGEPSSNNGYIYSAYCDKLGIQLDNKLLNECYNLCLLNGKFALRSPNKTTPYLSRDEVLGGVALGLTKPHHLTGWNFFGYPLPKFSLIKLLKQVIPLYQNRNDRNYFWKNNLDQIYRFAFSVPVVDRHFILKSWGKFQFYNPIHLFYAAVGKVSSLRKPNGIDWLKYGTGVEEMVLEFPEDHDIRQKLGL